MAARVVVLQPAFLGDVVFAGPLTRALTDGWPGCDLTFVARPPADEIARHLPGVNRVVVYDKRGKDHGMDGVRRIGAVLAELRPELAISLHDSARTALLAKLSGAPKRLGPSSSLVSPLYSQVENVDGLPFVDRSVALAAALGLSARPELELRLPQALRAAGKRTVEGRAAALIPGSEWETKRWPVEEMAKLARALRAAGLMPVLLGAPSERELCARLNELSGGVCHDLCGNRVEDALGVLAVCERAVGGDSGLTHAARALGVPTVALFGPTSPEKHRMSAKDRFVSLGLPCAPCSEHGDRVCPLEHHRCMRDLPAGRVEAALAELA